MPEVKVGCCGQAGLRLRDYSLRFRVIELQSTFYKLPKLDTARRWRKEVLGEFEFCIKAFQGVTHPLSSPTWRRAGSQYPQGAGEKEYGHLRPTRGVKEAWRRSMEVLEELKGRAIVVQLPPSFDASEENRKNLRKFFEEVERPPLLAVELRHRSWFEDEGELAGLLKSIGAVHVVDPLVRRPSFVAEHFYFRLHGLGRQPYKYKYTDEDLARLKGIVEEMEGIEGYVMLNNTNMKEDAERFLQLLKGPSG